MCNSKCIYLGFKKEKMIWRIALFSRGLVMDYLLAVGRSGREIDIS